MCKRPISINTHTYKDVLATPGLGGLGVAKLGWGRRAAPTHFFYLAFSLKRRMGKKT